MSGNAEGREDEEEGDPEEKWEIARTEAASLVARNPTSASAHGEAGLILDRSGQPREAITYLRHAVKLAPKGAVYYDMLGLVYRNAATSINRYLNGKNRRRLETQAAERVPGGDDPCYKREVATCFELKYYTNAQLHIAEEDFIRRVQADDSDEHGFGLLAQLYRNYSTTACVTALKLDPTRPTAYLTLARLLPKGGALKLYENALTLVPNRAGLYREFGETLADLRYFAQANKAYRTSIALEPSSHSGYESLAKLRLFRDRPEEAVSIAADYLATQRDAPVPPELAATSESAASRASSSGAVVTIATAIALMAEARCHQKRFREAGMLARSSIAIDPTSARGYLHLGHALYTDVGDLGPPPVRYRDKGLAANKNAQLAIDACTIAAKLDPGGAANRYRLGMLLRRIPGRLNEAIDSFNYCLMANVSYPGAQDANNEAVKRLREAQKPQRGWWALMSNLLPALILMGIMSHFFTS